MEETRNEEEEVVDTPSSSSPPEKKKNRCLVAVFIILIAVARIGQLKESYSRIPNKYTCIWCCVIFIILSSWVFHFCDWSDTSIACLQLQRNNCWSVFRFHLERTWSDYRRNSCWNCISKVIFIIFTGRLFLIILNRLTTGVVKLASVGGFIIFNGVAMAIMPFIKELWVLGLISCITSLTSSYFNTGLESLILCIWGPDNSRSIIAVYHFFFTFGGFLAPFLVGLFKRI